jgi:hypothetical protein
MFAGFGLAFMGAGLLLAVPSTMLSRRIFMLIAKTAAKVLAGIKTFIPKLEGV